jgi:ribosome biogenesis GTPase / thiamine phosphate phosphatase
MKKEIEEVGAALEGVVTEARGASYLVSAGDGKYYRCRTIAGTQTENIDASLVSVGDRVRFKESGESGEANPQGVITHVEKRFSTLERKRDVRRNRSKETKQVIASNIEQLVIVVAAFEPPLSTRLIDRYLVFAESENLPVVIVVNKMDLDDDGEIPALMEPYTLLGYTVILVSVRQKRGLEELDQLLSGKVSAMSGHSGVGKSSIINVLTGQKRMKTARTSYKNGKGVHTTSNAVMLPLISGGYLIDTPGIREFSLSGISREQLRFYFREFLQFMPECSYSSCSHTVEPGCSVRRAAEEGIVDPDRYESYLVLYEGLESEP